MKSLVINAAPRKTEHLNECSKRVRVIVVRGHGRLRGAIRRSLIFCLPVRSEAKAGLQLLHQGKRWKGNLVSVRKYESNMRYYVL